MKLLQTYPKFESLQDRITYKKLQRERLRKQIEMIQQNDMNVSDYGLFFLIAVAVFTISAIVLVYMVSL